MSIFDDITAVQSKLPPSLRDYPEAIIDGLNFGMGLFATLFAVSTLPVQREFFLRIAALAVQGVEGMDALIEAEEEDPSE